MSKDLATVITGDIGRLKQYLKDLYIIEKEMYCASEAVRTLDQRIAEASKEPELLESRARVDRESVHKSALGIAIAVAVVAAAIIMFIDMKVYYRLVDSAAGWLTLSAACGLVAYCVARFKKTGQDLTKQLKWIEEQNAAAIRYTEEQKALVPGYKKLREEYANCAQDCRRTLDTLYDSDVIFIKYRNLVAVSQFYEYIMAGRCFGLEGAEGAYNLYESESRLNRIITSLDQAVALLTEIRDTQYALLDAINTCNARLAQIEDYAAATAANTAAIAYNTAAIARNTQY